MHLVVFLYKVLAFVGNTEVYAQYHEFGGSCVQVVQFMLEIRSHGNLVTLYSVSNNLSDNQLLFLRRKANFPWRMAGLWPKFPGICTLIYLCRGLPNDLGSIFAIATASIIWIMWLKLQKILHGSPAFCRAFCCCYGQHLALRSRKSIQLQGKKHWKYFKYSFVCRKQTAPDCLH